MRVEEERAALEQLYARLTEALQSQRSEPYSAPVTVAEIYQELVPYRSVRGEPGFAMNADYEHALLRLLSGEGDWARLEPPSARDVILRELRSSNPNVTIYREYAGCDVWVKAPDQRRGATTPPKSLKADEPEDDDYADLELLATEIEEELSETPGGSSFPRTDRDSPAPSGAAGDAPAGAGSEAPSPETTSAPHETAGAPGSASGRAGGEPGVPPQPGSAGPSATAGGPGGQRGPESTANGSRARSGESAATSVEASQSPRGTSPTETSPGADEAATGEAGGRCVFCDSTLPARRNVRFCPYCGGDQSMVPCTACGEALEPGWLFCVACGAPADSG